MFVRIPWALPYRPSLLRALNRELFIRCLLIEHQRRYEVMLGWECVSNLIPNGYNPLEGAFESYICA